MKLKLYTAASITSLNIKKIQDCLKSTCLVFITADWCHFCKSFEPEKKIILTILREHNIIDINDVALNELKIRDYSTWKQIVPEDHRVYFPMIIASVNRSSQGRARKKVYSGPRTSREIRDYMKKIT